MKPVKVFQEPEMGVLAFLDQFKLPDQKPPLLYQVSFNGAILTVVAHLRLQIGIVSLYHSVNELPDTYRNDRCEGNAPPKTHFGYDDADAASAADPLPGGEPLPDDVFRLSAEEAFEQPDMSDDEFTRLSTEACDRAPLMFSSTS